MIFNVCCVVIMYVLVHCVCIICFPDIIYAFHILDVQTQVLRIYVTVQNLRG